MIDFTSYVKNYPTKRAYGGANGIKKGFLYNDEPYILKIETRDKKFNVYKNSVISEYISCKIFSILNIPTQEVILGTIEDNNKIKFCVACKDFKKDNEYFYDFISIKNTVLDDCNSNGQGTELSEVITSIKKQNFYNPKDVLEYFWDMFIVDSYLGNFDRHNGNWGILINDKTKIGRIAPIYDCGSCLFPKANDEQLQEFLENDEELEKRVSQFPNSAIKEQGKKINYQQFLTSTTDKDCLKAILKIVPLIKEKTRQINDFINSSESISPIRKQFYTTMLKMRFERILKPAEERALKLQDDESKKSKDFISK